jgi:hypothetical protein
MKKRIALLLLVAVVSNACSQSSKEKKVALEQGSKSVDTKLTELVQTVLDSPGIIKLSKADFLREKYGKIYMFFDENVPKPNSSIYQKGFVLEAVNSRVTDDIPCYVFEKISIEGDKAYVSLHLDVTGFICYGNLNYVNEKWVPDNDFKIGYR